MASEDSKFDTMRLIAGAEDSGLYSLEDILEEYAPEEAEKAAPSRQPEPAAPEPEKPREETIILPEAPEYHPESEAEIADAIAKALSSALGEPKAPAKATAPVKASAPTTEQAPKPRPASTPPRPVPPRPVPPKPAPAEEKPERPEKETPTETVKSFPKPPKPPQPIHTQPPAQEEPEQQEETLPNVKTAGEVRQVELQEPGAKQKKIPRSTVRVSTVEMLASVLGDLRARQRQDLPKNGTSLKATEKRQENLARFCGLLAPFRYIVLVLMTLSLLGRKFSWMLLGFLGGESGVMVSVMLTVLSLALSWHAVARAGKDMVYLRFSYESLLLVVTVLSLADTALTKNTQTLLPLLAIGWCLAGAADAWTEQAKLRALRTVITGKHRVGVRVARDKWEHMDCIGKAPASTAGFVRHQQEGDTWHAGWTAYALGLLVVALVISAYLTAKTQGSYLTILVTLLTCAMPVGGVLCCARPYAMLTRILGSRGAVAGWFGIKALSGKKAMLVYDRDLFPPGTITHKGVKVYGNQTPELLINYGASLVLRADNGLSEPFTQLLREIGGQPSHVSYFQVLEGGLLGRINGVPVAVGTYNFMQLMGSMPPKGAPKGGIFIALNGQVAGVFAIKYRVKATAAENLWRLTRSRGLTLVAATKNLCVNPAFLRAWFQVRVGDMACPKVETRRMLSQPSLMSRGTTCGFLTTEGIGAYSRLVASARRSYLLALLATVGSILLSAVLFVLTVRGISGGTAVLGGARLALIQLALALAVELGARFSVK